MLDRCQEPTHSERSRVVEAAVERALLSLNDSGLRVSLLGRFSAIRPPSKTASQTERIFQALSTSPMGSTDCPDFFSLHTSVLILY